MVRFFDAPRLGIHTGDGWFLDAGRSPGVRDLSGFLVSFHADILHPARCKIMLEPLFEVRGPIASVDLVTPPSQSLFLFQIGYPGWASTDVDIGQCASAVSVAKFIVSAAQPSKGAHI